MLSAIRITVNYTWTKTGTNTWDLNVNIPMATDANGNLYNATIPLYLSMTDRRHDGGNHRKHDNLYGKYADILLLTLPQQEILQIGNMSIPWSEWKAQA